MPKTKNGSALVFTLITLTAMMVVAIASYEAAIVNQGTSIDTSKSASSIQAADTGVEIVTKKLQDVTPSTLLTDSSVNLCNVATHLAEYVDTTTLAGKKISVQVLDGSGNQLTACETKTVADVRGLKSAGEYGGTIRTVQVGLFYGGNDQYTTLLLHFDGSDNTPTFTDSSTSAKTISSGGGSPVIRTSASSVSPKFGTGSLYLNGSSYITAPNSTDFDFGSGDFTIDWWEYRIDGSNSHPTFQRSNNSSTGFNPFLVGWAGSGNLYFYASSNPGASSWDITGPGSGVSGNRLMGTIELDEWVHLAVVRNGNTFFTFKNGIQTSTWSSSASFAAGTSPLEIGRYRGAYYFPGYIDEFRISKGVARWTSNFTPPVAAY